MYVVGGGGFCILLCSPYMVVVDDVYILGSSSWCTCVLDMIGSRVSIYLSLELKICICCLNCEHVVSKSNHKCTVPVVASNGKYGSYPQGTCFRILELIPDSI